MSSAPVRMENSKDNKKEEEERKAARTKAWASNDRIESSRRSKHANDQHGKKGKSSKHRRNGNDDDDDDDESIAGRQPAPPLHVHSISFPAWPSLSDTDPAIDLIRSIKEELKKFDHQVH